MCPTRMTVILQIYYSRLLVLTFRHDILPLLSGSSQHFRSDTKWYLRHRLSSPKLKAVMQIGKWGNHIIRVSNHILLLQVKCLICTLVSNFLFFPRHHVQHGDIGEVATNSIRFVAIFTVCTVDPETMVYKPLNKNQIASSSMIALKIQLVTLTEKSL